MSPIEISAEVANKKEFEKNFDSLIDEIPQGAQEALLSVAKWTVYTVSQYPGEIEETRKFPWRSRKQQKAIMASAEDQRIPWPYERKFRFRNSWKIDEIERGVRITNLTDYARFLIGGEEGEYPALFHAGRWNLFRPTIDRYLEEEFPEEVRQNIEVVAARRGF